MNMFARPLCVCACAGLLTALPGCSQVQEPRSTLLDRALGAVGLQRQGAGDKASAQTLQATGAISNRNAPGQPGLPDNGRRVVFKMHAGQVLNLDGRGQSLPVVARVFKLRDKAIFERLPYAAFQAPGPGISTDLNHEVVETRELVLAPGQKYEVVDTLGAGVQYFAVVVLFRAPAAQRWRFIFEAGSAANTGISLGLHGCAASVATGQALGVPFELMRVAGVRCDGDGAA